MDRRNSWTMRQAEIWQEVDRLFDHRPPTLCGINFMPITKAGSLIVMVMSWSRSVIKWLPFSVNQQNSKGTTCTSQHIYKPLRQNQTTITVQHSKYTYCTYTCIPILLVYSGHDCAAVLVPVPWTACNTLLCKISEKNMASKQLCNIVVDL